MSGNPLPICSWCGLGITEPTEYCAKANGTFRHLWRTRAKMAPQTGRHAITCEEEQARFDKYSFNIAIDGENYILQSYKEGKLRSTTFHSSLGDAKGYAQKLTKDQIEWMGGFEEGWASK